jgi:tRNA pseudouridine13 synthase
VVRWRVKPEDFRVDEIPLYPASGAGGHTFVRVEKRLLTTEQVARALARAAGVRPRDVGYAGRKDRVAVATQWLSVPGLEPERASAIEREGLRVLETRRHPHKLRTGQLRANRFAVAVRGADSAALEAAEARLAVLLRVGMPNRFGAQRFGRDGGNPERALRILSDGSRGSDRRSARFLLSSLQSAVFNDVLAARRLRLDALEPGDVAWIHASGACFAVEDVRVEAPRAAAFEISATGPIFGTRMKRASGAVAERERQAMVARGVDLEGLRVPRGIRLQGARRPFRVRPGEAAFDRRDDGAMLRFVLPPGSYASVLVDELFPEAVETPPARMTPDGVPGYPDARPQEGP